MFNFTFCHTQTQHTTRTSHFKRWGVEDRSLVGSTTNVVTKLVGRFGNQWSACFRDLMGKNFAGYSVIKPMTTLYTETHIPTAQWINTG